MNEVLQQLTLDVTYRTGPLAKTDLHAGGLFFCVIYRECLQFGAGGRVRRWCEVLDDSRPLDDEADKLRELNHVGTYCVNDRGYLECMFPNMFPNLKLTGLPSERTPELLAFHAYRSQPGVSFSLVYFRGAVTARP